MEEQSAFGMTGGVFIEATIPWSEVARCFTPRLTSGVFSRAKAPRYSTLN